MSAPNYLDDYVDVAERIRSLFEQHPHAVIRCGQPETVTIGERVFIRQHADVYKTPDDPLPTRAYATEPFPGKTAYTRDSEQMNCETSAVGRAIALMGIGTRRSIASLQEVRNRQQDDGGTILAPEPLMSPDNQARFRGRTIEAKMTADQVAEVVRAATGGRTSDPHQVHQSEIAALRNALEQWITTHPRQEPAKTRFVRDTLTELDELGYTQEQACQIAHTVVNRDVNDIADLTRPQIRQVMDTIRRLDKGELTVNWDTGALEIIVVELHPDPGNHPSGHLPN